MMKFRNLFASIGLLASIGTMAQSIPTHDMYVDFGITDKNKMIEALDKWTPGSSFSDDPAYMDDNFFISRVPLKERFWNNETKANKDLTDVNNKNLCWWTPIGEMTKKWGPLPRYNFEADNFNMWQYINIHGNWSNSWFRVPGAFNDVAHKNGVKTGCLYFIDWAASVTESSEAGKFLGQLCAKDGSGNFKYARKLIQFLKYYGIDGIGINPEGYWSSTLNENFSSFLAECHKVAKEENWPFHVDWYAFVSNSGGLSDNGCSLGIGENDKWFQKNGEPVTDVFFLNYNWGESQLIKSAEAAKSLGRSTFDVYAGFDQQGRGYGLKWSALMRQPVSVVVWGAHDRSQLYASSTEGGTSDLAIQKEYQTKQELLFTGGTRNVLNTPPVTDAQVTANLSQLKNWHGYSKAVIEESALTETPFFTRFNLGNGMFFKKDGVTTFDHKWYNIGIQDMLPTWRWWIDNGDGQTVPADAIQCDFTFDDAWFAGSCLKIHGATAHSDIRLFRTKFNVVSGEDKFSLTFKVNSGTDPKMKLMVSKEGHANTFAYYTIPAEGIAQGEWTTITVNASELGLQANDVIGCIGLSVAGTDSNYETLLGELSFVPSDFNKTPVRPTIAATKVMKRVYNRADFKITFNSAFTGDRKPEYEGCPIYNEEVNTSYFEIYVKQKDVTPFVVTTTTSWAAYVVDAPLKNTTDPTFQIGVRAIGLDGKKASPIVWSDALESDLAVIETINIDKDIIKPGEEFTIGFEDPNHAVSKFQIYNSLTGEEVRGNEAASLSFTTSLPEEGTYDVKVTSEGKENMTRGLLLVSKEETGRLPEVTNILADNTEPKADAPVKLTAEINEGVTYNGADCNVSQALYMKEPYQLTVNSGVLSNYQTTSFGLWFKVEKFEHASLGTLLMTKVNRNYAGTWTEKVWGEMWTAIRPLDYSKYANAENELSVSVDAPPAGTPNYEHNAEVDGITTGYSLTPGVWYHVCVVKNGKNVKMYLNGKKVLDVTSRGSGPKDWKGANFYVGGNMTNLASFTGWVDEVQIWDKALTDAEVQQSMKGYRIAPTGLQGYFTFEETQTDDDGNTYFPNKGKNSTLVKGAYMTISSTANDKTTDTPQNQLSTALGVPSITGVRKVTFESAKWILEGASFTQDSNTSATASYTKEGKYPVSLTLTNSWGTTTKTINDYIVVKGGVGIENQIVEDLSIYPNPFMEYANILFSQEGKYDVRVCDTQGKLITAKQYHADNNEVCQLSFDAPKGVYYVIISRNGKCVRSFKVIKE